MLWKCYLKLFYQKTANDSVGTGTMKENPLCQVANVEKSWRASKFNLLTNNKFKKISNTLITLKLKLSLSSPRADISKMKIYIYFKINGKQ